MAKKATKGYYARERDAKSAAIKQGLKEGEFDIDYGPKGYSVRKKPIHPTVEGAKLHGIGQPDSGEQEPVTGMFEPTDSKWIMKEKASKRFRWVDETGGFSNESYETQSQAQIALDAYTRNVLGEPKPSLTIYEDDSYYGNPLGDSPHDPGDTIIGGDTAESDHPGIEEHSYDTETVTEIPLVTIELPIQPKTEPAPCLCGKTVPTFVGGDNVLRYIEHPVPADPTGSDPMSDICNESEEPVKNVPISIKISELPVGAPAFVAARTETTEKGGTTPSTRLKKSTLGDPTKSVWHIADEMFSKNPATARKDVVAACVASGIAFYTARTQYQQWLTARRESAQHAAEANAKKE